MATSLTPVRIPDVPIAAVPDLGKAVIGLFESAKRHPPPQKPEMEVTQQLGEMARQTAQRLVSLGILAHRPKEEAPLLVFGSLYRSLGCQVSAWMYPSGRGLLQVQGCNLRNALALVGMDCRGVCTRMRQSALKSLAEPVSVNWSPGKEGCVFVLQPAGAPGKTPRADTAHQSRGSNPYPT